MSDAPPKSAPIPADVLPLVQRLLDAAREEPGTVTVNLFAAVRALDGVTLRPVRTLEWRPFDTAPKDGTSIIVRADHGHYVVRWDDEDNDPNRLWAWVVDDNKHGPYPLRGRDPTHWMHVPPDHESALTSTPKPEDAERVRKVQVLVNACHSFFSDEIMNPEPGVGNRVVDALRALQSDEKYGPLVIHHERDEAIAYADRIVIERDAAAERVKALEKELEVERAHHLSNHHHDDATSLEEGQAQLDAMRSERDALKAKVAELEGNLVTQKHCTHVEGMRSDRASVERDAAIARAEEYGRELRDWRTAAESRAISPHALRHALDNAATIIAAERARAEKAEAEVARLNDERAEVERQHDYVRKGIPEWRARWSSGDNKWVDDAMDRVCLVVSRSWRSDLQPAFTCSWCQDPKHPDPANHYGTNPLEHRILPPESAEGPKPRKCKTCGSTCECVHTSEVDSGWMCIRCSLADHPNTARCPKCCPVETTSDRAEDDPPSSYTSGPVGGTETGHFAIRTLRSGDTIQSAQEAASLEVGSTAEQVRQPWTKQTDKRWGGHFTNGFFTRSNDMMIGARVLTVGPTPDAPSATQPATPDGNVHLDAAAKDYDEYMEAPVGSIGESEACGRFMLSIITHLRGKP